METFRSEGEVKITMPWGGVWTFPRAVCEFGRRSNDMEVRCLGGDVEWVRGQAEWWVYATGGDRIEVSVESDARRLARAVLAGDEEAALLLADEVQERYARPAGYVSHDTLRARLVEVYALVKRWWAEVPHWKVSSASLLDATQDLLDREGLR